MGRLSLGLLLLPALAGAVLPVGEIRFKSAPGYTYCSMAVRVVDRMNEPSGGLISGGVPLVQRAMRRGAGAKFPRFPLRPSTTPQAFGPFLPSKSKAPELLLVEALPGAAESIGGKGDGCEPIVLPPTLPAGKPFGLLLPRGRCPFEQKAVAAEAAGAALLVIYNNEEVRFDAAFDSVQAVHQPPRLPHSNPHAGPVL